MEEVLSLKRALLELIDGLIEDLSALSDGFYRNPENSCEEHSTSSSMQGFLIAHGFSVKSNIARLPTAFAATFGSKRPRIALLAEMDALPEIGHGCGHNIAGTASVGAGAALAKLLSRKKLTDRGTVLVLGTPAEEFGSGKTALLKAGIFKDVDCAMMVHPSSSRTVFKHFLGLVRLEFTFLGRASHAAAYPERGINALDGVIQTFNLVNALKDHLSSDIRIHGIITEGGKAPNIIPERAQAIFYVRARDSDGLDYVKGKVIGCAEGARRATGCKLEVNELGESNAPMRINNAFLEVYREQLKFLNLVEEQKNPDKNVGSSDIGNVSQVVPTIHPHVPIRKGVEIHTREFAESTITPDGHRALLEGVRCLGLTALDLIFEPEKLKDMKREFSNLDEKA